MSMNLHAKIRQNIFNNNYTPKGKNIVYKDRNYNYLTLSEIVYFLSILW